MRVRRTGGHETINILTLRRAFVSLLSPPLVAQVFLAPTFGFSTTC